MEAIIVTGLQYLLAAILGIGGLKGGEAFYKKYRAKEENPPEISAIVCRMKHESLDNRLGEISKDVTEIKKALEKLIDLQMQLISLRGDLKDTIHMEMDKHETRYHKVP